MDIPGIVSQLRERAVRFRHAPGKTETKTGGAVLRMSGFTDGMLVLNEGWHFLAMPFIPSQTANVDFQVCPS